MRARGDRRVFTGKIESISDAGKLAAGSIKKVLIRFGSALFAAADQTVEQFIVHFGGHHTKADVFLT